MIYDRNGSLVWIGSTDFGMSFDLKLQDYQGQPVLTVFNGTITDGHGQGTVGYAHRVCPYRRADIFQCWIMDETYTVIADINSVGGGGTDLHEV